MYQVARILNLLINQIVNKWIIFYPPAKPEINFTLKPNLLPQSFELDIPSLVFFLWKGSNKAANWIFFKKWFERGMGQKLIKHFQCLWHRDEITHNIFYSSRVHHNNYTRFKNNSNNKSDMSHPSSFIMTRVRTNQKFCCDVNPWTISLKFSFITPTSKDMWIIRGWCQPETGFVTYPWQVLKWHSQSQQTDRQTDKKW